jgi:DNA-binding NarL/FixJ family response regulator
VNDIGQEAIPRQPGPQGPPVRLLLADDHLLMRRGLEAVLSREPDFVVVGEAADGGQAIAAALELLPDVVLLDIRMPVCSGLEAGATIKQHAPAVKIIILTVSDDEADLYAAIRAGATGYLLKDIAADELARAIRAVHQGHSVINPAIAAKLLTDVATMAGQTRGYQTPTPSLTERELEVLSLVARGRNNREIGAYLFISEHTVKNHVRNILEKLQLHSRTEAVYYAVREKLLDPK